VTAARERGVDEPWKVCSMSSSSRFYILSLGLLIAVSGCSGSRMRKAFRADREFLTLSELEEYDARRDEADEQPKPWSEKLASFSRRSSDEKEEATSERQGFLNFGRLLVRDDDSIPPDPFVVADHEEEFSDSDEDQIIVSVGASKELKSDDAEPLVGDDWVTEMAASAAAADRLEADDQSGTGISFSDIMAEFADEPEEEDDLDALADQLMAEHSSKTASLDDMVVDFSNDSIDAGDVDQFELSPDMFLDDTTKPEDDVPVLSIDESADNPFSTERNVVSVEEPIPGLPDVVDRSSAFDFAEPTLEISAANVRDPQGAVSAASTAGGLDAVDIFGDDLLDRGSLWRSSDQATGWESEQTPGRTQSPQTQPANGQQVEAAWNSPSSPVHAGSPFGRSSKRPRPEDSMTFASSPLVLPESQPIQENALPQVSTNLPVAGELTTNPFLDDFKTQAETSPAAAPVSPATTNDVVAGFSPKMWVVLVGSIIILCLLFAPERQNVSELSNR